MISKKDIVAHRRGGSWRELERIAQEITLSAKQHGGEFFAPVLGGGTRLMLAFEHRISDDIDLFVDSPGWLPYVSPRTNERFEGVLHSYNEDGEHVKWVFPNGEIDFIVRTSLLDPQGLWNPAAPETTFALEAPLEVLAKKLFYRGWALTPRDLFDWYCIELHAPISRHEHIELAELLADRLQEIRVALARMPEKQLVSQAWERIKAPFIPDLRQTTEWAVEQLALYELLAREAKAGRQR